MYSLVNPIENEILLETVIYQIGSEIRHYP